MCELALEMYEENLRDSPVFRGNLGDNKIAKLQRYYGYNIRRNTGNLDEMIQDCWAVFYHSCSSDTNVQHHMCPTGPDSWCRYNKAVHNGDDLHHDPDKILIPPNLAPYVKEEWEKLCHEDLLAKCVLGATQNRNESFNSVVWNRCSKTDFSSHTSVQVALYLAVLTFNKGTVPLLPLLEDLGGIQPSPYCVRTLFSIDAMRLYRSMHYDTEVQKRKRQSDRELSLRHEQQLVREEGVTYEPGGF